MTVDTLFDIFCECAELNPEPIEGSILKIQPYYYINDAISGSIAVYMFVSLYLSEEEEEGGHNWVFSADQMDVRGEGNVFIRLDQIQEQILQ